VATTRRGFLRLLGSGAALATLARIPVLPPAARAAADAAADAGGAAFFDTGQRRILGAVVARMVDTGEAPVDPADAVATIDALCASLDPALTEPLPLLVRLVEWSPPLFQLRFARFTNLPPGEQDDCLRDWMTSRLGLRRMGFAALKNLSMLGWYSQERSWASVGYAGPLLGRGSER
jgi:hypothetical protein